MHSWKGEKEAKKKLSSSNSWWVYWTSKTFESLQRNKRTTKSYHFRGKYKILRMGECVNVILWCPAPTETKDSTYRSSETSTKNSEIERNSICNSSTFNIDSEEQNYRNDIFLANNIYAFTQKFMLPLARNISEQNEMPNSKTKKYNKMIKS